MKQFYPIKIRIIESVHVDNKTVNENWEKEGFYYESPIVGKSFRLFDSEKNILKPIFGTTPVTEVLDGNMFKTRNSTYELF